MTPKYIVKYGNTYGYNSCIDVDFITHIYMLDRHASKAQVTTLSFLLYTTGSICDSKEYRASFHVMKRRLL